MKLGVQCYGLQNMPKENPRSFFEKLYGMGYRLVEPFIWFDKKPEEEYPVNLWSIWQAEEAAARLRELQEIGFETSSAHVLGDPASALADMISLAEEFGIRQYVVGLPQPIEEQTLRRAAKSYQICAEKLALHGITLLVHNGGAEPTAVKIEGKTAYEFLLEQAGERLGAQPDIGWLAAGGVCPLQWIKDNQKQIWSLHYKDYKDGRELPIGKGELDLYTCFQMARVLDIPQIIDMDTCTLEDLEEAARLFQSFENRRDWTDSVLCILEVDSGEITELQRFDTIIEAPNWSPDGSALYYNADGLIYRYDLGNKVISQVDTGICTNCNNDHVLSSDGTEIAVSHMNVEQGFSSYIYRISLTGEKDKREPKKITPNSPSFLHGWSKDGELVYCAFRGEAENTVDIYVISEEGGTERRLTDGRGYNDGPEYSPDGRQIWFNSTRDGLMQIYHMDRDGSNLVQVTHTRQNEWFPHISPDGTRVVYLTFQKGDLDPSQHVANLYVSLSVMDCDGTNVRKLTEFFGGQGTINVNSWSPDSKQIAFVKYVPKVEMVHRSKKMEYKENKERKAILNIKIDMDAPPVQLKAENGEVVMIPFKGSVKGELFTGIVEPCGVDTQVVNAAGVRHMSARYMLTGTDREGEKAHIYVENNGWFDERNQENRMPFHTVPTFYTDSKALAPYLHRNQFEGEGRMEEEGLHIYFYEIKHEE